ncbi:MAG: hypothetical protein FWC10_00385 [Lentimicrobiaceae bacterium]|nr:hypothetical protein [Lentimicrobiaceae bacterium]
MKKITSFVIATCICFCACKRPVQYSEIPEIKFISFEQLSQTAGLLTLYFQDGDGDLGLDRNDTYPPFDNSSIYFYNFFCDYYEKQNGVFIKIDSTETNIGLTPFNLHARFPRLSSLPEESINGDIFLKLTPYRIKTPFDTIQLKFYIVDRKLNHSNVEEIVVIRNNEMMR